MAKQTSPVRMADRKSTGKQNAKNKPRSKIDSNKQIKIQKALYEIADAASAVTDMQAFYKRLHEIVGALMYAGNFFIATYDEQSGLLSFPYCVDEVDPTPAPQPLSDFHGMTSWIIRTGYMGKRGWDQSNELVASGEIEMVGTPNEDGMIAPLKAEGKVIGVVAVQSYTKGIGYTDEDEQVLEFVAQHISTALTRARAIEETRQRNSELAILNSVGEAMAKTLDVKTVARIVGDKVRDIFSADQIGILLYEQQTNLMHLIYGYDKANNRYVDDIQIKPIPLGKGLTSKVIESRQPLLLGTREEQDAHGHYMPPEAKGLIKPSESWLGVPIMLNEMVLGVALVEDYRPHVYNENHLRLLQTLSSNMGTAIQNARLFDETQRLLKVTEDRAAELAIINSVQEGLASQLDMQAIFDLVGGKVGEIFNVNEVGISIYDRKTNLEYFPYAVQKGRRLSQDPIPHDETGFIPLVMRTRQPIMINEHLAERAKEIGSYMLGGAEMPLSAIYVPLVIGEEARGVIVIASDREQAFTDSDLRLLSTLANSMSVALENARLFNETQHLLKETEDRAAELAVINRVQEGLASKLDYHAIVDLVGDTIREIFHTQSLSIGRYDHASQMVDYSYVVQNGQRTYYEPMAFSGVARHLIRTRQMLVVSENVKQRMDELGSHWGGMETPRTLIYVPLIAGDAATGVVAIYNYERENAFSDSDIRLLETLASAMSVALENARLFDETQQRNAELAIINSVQEGLASKLEMQGIYDLVGDKVREIFDANTVVLATFDLDKNLMCPHYAIEKGQRFFIEPVPIPAVWADFIQRGQSLLINNNLLEYIQRFDENPKPLAGEIPKSALAVPLMINGELRGAISLQNIDRENAFNESDMRLLQTLANSMSVALENARLWEQEKLYRKALQRELEIGREIQAGFLPETLPQVEGWEIAALLMSAREVAGDFYDAFELPDGTIGLVIADVCDKGVGAALFMTLFRSLIRAASNLEYFEHTESVASSHSTAERLKRAVQLTNNYIAETHGTSGMFATLFFGILDPRGGRLTYINGGHEPPLILHVDGRNETLQKTGPAVGAITDGHFNLSEATLHEGDIFLAFTDGVPDCKNPHGDFYGRERLRDIFRESNESAQGLVDVIESDLHQYIANTTQFDDITLLAMRRK